MSNNLNEPTSAQVKQYLASYRPDVTIEFIQQVIDGYKINSQFPKSELAGDVVITYDALKGE